MNTTAPAAYRNYASRHRVQRARKCGKAQKSSGFRASGTYRRCIKDYVLIDYASVSGAFISGWLGGILLEKTGGYDLIWISSMVLSLLAGLLATRVKEESDS